MFPGTDFLLNLVFVRGLSGLLHLVLLLGLFVSWVKSRFFYEEGPSERFKETKSLYYKPTLFCCLGVSVFNLVLCILDYFYWDGNDWSEERVVTLLDLALRTLSWGAVSVYLHAQFSTSAELRFSFLLRVWWGFYFFISCYCLVIDIVRYTKQVTLPFQTSVSDSVSFLAALFFIYVGILRKQDGEITILGEPLLHGNDTSENAESNKLKGDTNVTPLSNAGIFSIVTFSWMGPLISVGNKKTLDLEDVPQLDTGDSVIGAFPTFRSELVSDCDTISRVTTLKLVKAIVFTARKEIALTALFALLYSVASYVGPYLIDYFVQYLNGQQEFRNEGFILVSAFFTAKVVECLAQRQWSFRVQKFGVRIRAVLVAAIYNKGLTLSCQSKQRHTSGEGINYMTIDAERIGDFSWYMHDPWMVLVQVALALLILYKSLGLAAISAFVATVLVMLVNLPLAKLQEEFQGKLMDSKDIRMKSTSEILRNMRILKFQGWEMKFLSKIVELRKNETGWLKKFAYAKAIDSFVLWGAPTFVSVATFGTCMILGIPLESGKILSALATFRILQEPIYNLPDTISMIAQTKVSLDRISSFLCLDDL